MYRYVRFHSKPLCLSLVLLLLVFSGCAEEDPFPEGDKGEVYNLVREVADAAGRASFANYFAEGAVPDAQQEAILNNFVCVPEGEIEFEGDSVTFQVTLEDLQGNPTVVTWTAQKVGELWKLTNTPLSP